MQGVLQVEFKVSALFDDWNLESQAFVFDIKYNYLSFNINIKGVWKIYIRVFGWMVRFKEILSIPNCEYTNI